MSAPAIGYAERMLSALIFDADEPVALADTLATLVPGAIEGVLREVVVVDGGHPEVRRVADHAGCRLDDLSVLADIAASFKGDWVLVVRCGDRLGADWVELAARHAAGSERTEAGRLDTSVRGGRDWTQVWRPRPRALIVPKAHLARRLAAKAPPGDWARGLRVRRLRETVR